MLHLSVDPVLELECRNLEHERGMKSSHVIGSVRLHGAYTMCFSRVHPVSVERNVNALYAASAKLSIYSQY